MARILILVLLAACASALQAQDKVEVLHRWTSPGELKARDALVAELARQGIAWTDMVVRENNPAAQVEALRNRLSTNDPPTAAMMTNVDLPTWGKLGALADLTPLAQREGWDKVVPKLLQDSGKYQGRWVAVPINMQSFNWMWAHRGVLERAGIQKLPETWDAFIADLEKLRRMGGVIPLAMSAKGWENTPIFESVVLATGGMELHRAAFTERDRRAITGPAMKRVFERMSQLRGYADPGFAQRGWAAATALVIQGKAGFQLQPAWAGGEFTAAGQQPGRDFLCAAAPGTQGNALVIAGWMGFMNLGSGGFKRPGAEQAQLHLASAMMSREAQTAYNVSKGSLPARTDVSEAPFDACARQGLKDIAAADRRGGLGQPLGRVLPTAVTTGIQDIVEQHFSGKINNEQAVANLAVLLE